MVDPEDLLLAGVAGQLPVQLAGRFQVMAKGLFDHHPLPALSVFLMQQPGSLHLLDHLAKLAGRGGEIEEQVPPQGFALERGELFPESLVCRRGVDVALAIGDMLRKLLPDLLIHGFGARELVQR